MNHLTVQQLSSALDGALVGPSLEVVVRHLAVCGDCRDRQSRLVRHDDVLRRLLSPEAGEAFLEALGSRAEDIAVSIVRGVQPPPMATTVPLLHEEDPYQPGEPPMDPSLGLDRLVAQEGGYGRIGMKPTGTTQPPESDADEARRWLDAVENGTHGDPNAYGADPQDLSRHDSPAFELPSWMEDRGTRGASASPPPREPQRLWLVPTPGETPTLPFAATDPAEADPYGHRSLMPMSVDPHAARMPASMPGYPPASAPPPSYAQPSDPYSESFEEPPPPAYATLETGYATRGTAIAAARRRAQDEARRRGLQRHWLIAAASVCVLLLIVLALQLTPPKDKSAVAGKATMPRDSLVIPGSSELRSASSPTPVDEVVPPMPRDVPADSADVFAEDAPEDSLSGEPE